MRESNNFAKRIVGSILRTPVTQETKALFGQMEFSVDCCNALKRNCEQLREEWPNSCVQRLL